MNSHFRKFYIGIISLGVLFVVYLLYGQITQTPDIEIDTRTRFIDTIDQGGDERAGKIGDVGLANVRKTEFLHRNKNGEVDREFGFEELLYQVQDEWEIREPYLNVFLPQLTCNVTADTGIVQVETAVGKPSPKDATFTGNVVVHISPEQGSDVEESFIYLDDISFVSEKSLFSTPGPINFMSNSAQMHGTGLELVYNEQVNRLELFRIVDLDSLRLSQSKPVSDSVAKTQVDRSSDLSSTSFTQTSEFPTTQEKDIQSSKEADTREEHFYKCVFTKNVLIDTPDQLVFAKDRITIGDVLWPKLSARQSSTNKLTTQNEVVDAHTTLPEAGVSGVLSDEPVNIVVTCDGGVSVIPMDSTNNQIAEGEADTTDSANATIQPEPNGITQQAIFVAEEIYYNASTGDGIANGPLKVTFYARNPSGAKQGFSPVQISAEEKAQFFSEISQIVLSGDCLCTILRQEPNILHTDSFSAPKFIIDLLQRENDASVESFRDITHLAADGGLVKLNTIRTKGQELLGGIELRCRRFDYDIEEQRLLARGPGIIKLNNSKTALPVAESNEFGSRERCYAFLRGFETLEYHRRNNKIIADAGKRGTLRADYMPVIKDSYGPQTIITANHVEVSLKQNQAGQTELSSLTASGTITFEDGSNQFLGSRLTYDHGSFDVNIWGDELQPCYLNGTSVEGIEYNLKTGKFKARIPAPGTLGM